MTTQGLLLYLSILLGLLFIHPNVHGQSEDYFGARQSQDTVVYVKKFSGQGYVGVILKDDSKEIVLRTESLGKITIPKNVIESIEPVDINTVRIADGALITEDFAPRYFLTGSAHSQKKQSGVINWNPLGMELFYGVTDNFDVGLGTTWFGIPLVLNTKYSFGISENVEAAIGARVYTGSWASINTGAVFPYGCITLGNTHTHLTLNGGFLTAYGPQSENALAWIFGMAGKAQITPKVDAVFEVLSVPLISGFDPVYFIIPGLRFHNEAEKAFQIGFAGIASGDEVVPFPVPVIQFMRTF